MVKSSNAFSENQINDMLVHAFREEELRRQSSAQLTFDAEPKSDVFPHPLDDMKKLKESVFSGLAGSSELSMRGKRSSAVSTSSFVAPAHPLDMNLNEASESIRLNALRVDSACSAAKCLMSVLQLQLKHNDTSASGDEVHMG
jgi:hypothetical protein